MYKGKRYRIGSGIRRMESSKNSITSIPENMSTISSVTNPPITSTPNEPIAGPSNAVNERKNLPPSQPAPSQRQPVIISNDDDFAVPASQVMQPSRYISQRSALIRSQLSNTQQTPSSYFDSVLGRCGVVFTARNSDISYSLNCDHLKFVVRLRRELTSHPKYPENIQTFLSGLTESMKNPTQFNKVLSGCIVSDLFKIILNLIFHAFQFIIILFHCTDHIAQQSKCDQTIVRKFDEWLSYDWLFAKGHNCNSVAKNQSVSSWRVSYFFHWMKDRTVWRFIYLFLFS